eukprot:m.60716 g.60716  ORF g.60716 m.60716 type:complete len:1009 (+) comp11346_c0_seq3:277-3303(+)
MGDHSALVVKALIDATSQDPPVMKAGEQLLSSLESQNGYFTALAEIMCSQDSVPNNARVMAIMVFKNRFELYWKAGENCVSQEEKIRIRSCLLGALNERNKFVAKNQAELIGRIARKDVPHEWVELLPGLAQMLKEGNEIQQLRALLLLYRAMKALASKRLRQARATFHQITQSLLSLVSERLTAAFDGFLASFGNAKSAEEFFALLPTLEHARLTLKLARLMLAFGCPGYHQNDVALGLLNVVVGRHQMLLAARNQIYELQGNLLEELEKAITHCNKLYIDIQEKEPVAFVHVMNSILPLAYKQISEGKHSRMLERSTILFMTLLVQILNCQQYRPSRAAYLEDVASLLATGTQVPPEKLDAMRLLLGHDFRASDGILQQQALIDMCHTMVLKYFILTEEEQSQWAESPEEFAYEEAGEAWRFSLRPCSEKLYSALIKNFKTTLAPVVVEMLKTALSTEITSKEVLLQREAVYCSLSGGSGNSSVASDLYDYIPFDNLYQQTLIGELQSSEPAFNILQRRVIWLLGEWISVSFDSKGALGLRKSMFQAIHHLLMPGRDIVIRVTASATLRNAVDDFDFKAEDLTPVLGQVMGSLFQLLCDVRLCESKMKVLDVITLLIDRLGIHIQDHARSLAQYMPTLWQDTSVSPEYGMLRTAIVRSLVKLVATLGPSSMHLHDFLSSVICQSVDMQLESSVYLVEDGLELWHVVVQKSTEFTDTLRQLFIYMFPLLERDDEYLRTCLTIIRSYVLLGHASFLREFGSRIVISLTGLVGNMPKDGPKILASLCETIILLFGGQGTELLDPILLLTVKDVFEKKSLGTTAFVWPSFMTLGRVVMSPGGCDQFMQLMMKVSTENGGGDILGAFLDIWFEQLDTISDTATRKLSVLALCQMLVQPAMESFVQPRFSLFLNAIVGGLIEFHQPMHSEDILPVDMMVRDDEVEGVGDENTRKMQLAKLDSVFNINTGVFVMQCIEQMKARMGENQFSALLGTVDGSITSQLEPFVIRFRS